MFYYPQSLILAEFEQHQNPNEEGSINYELEDQDEYQDSSIIFELSHSYIQNRNQDHIQNDQNNHSHSENNEQQGISASQYLQNQGQNNHQNNLQDIEAQAQPVAPAIQVNELDMIQSDHMGLFYLVINRWLSNLADPVLLVLFFLAGFVNSSSIRGEWSDTLKYTNFLVGACCVVSNLINVLRLIKGKREQILLPLPQNPPQEEIQNANSQEKLQQTLNNIYFTVMISIAAIQVILMVSNKRYEDNIYQRYLLLVFLYERIVMYLIQHFRKHPKTIKKLLLYCVAAWPVYRKEFDEYVHYNFDFAVQIQSTFAKDPVQNYLKFMIYIYEFILVLQIIAFGCSQPKQQTIFSEFSYFFGAFYYFSIIYIAGLNYYVVTQNIHLSTKLNRVKNSVFLIVFFSSYSIFIILQLISALIQEKNKEYYILQFEPIFSFYFVCISMRVILNRVTLRSLRYEIMKHQKISEAMNQVLSQNNQQQLQPPQNNNNNILNELMSQNEEQMSNNNNNQRNNRHSRQQQNLFNIENMSQHSIHNVEQQSHLSRNSQNVYIINNTINNNNNNNNSNNQIGINRNNSNFNNSNQLNQNINLNNSNRQNGVREQQEQINHFQQIKQQLREMMQNQDGMLQKNINLIVNYEGYTITISLALQLFVYMFSDNLEIYEQNSVVCNLYYFLSIFSFMFYFLASKKVSLAYDKLKNPSEPLSYYWVIPCQSYLNKLGWYLSWVLSFILIYLYFNVTFTNNTFVKAEYIFMIFFSLFSFFLFQIIHFVRRILHPKYYSLYEQ